MGICRLSATSSSRQPSTCLSRKICRSLFDRRCMAVDRSLPNACSTYWLSAEEAGPASKLSGSSSSSARRLRLRVRSMAALSAMRWIQESSAASPRNSSRWFQALSNASWTASAARSASRVMRRQALYQRTLRSLSTAWKASGRTQDLRRVSTQLGRPSRQKVSKARKLLLFDGLERREVHPAAQVPGDHADLLLFGFPGVRHH